VVGGSLRRPPIRNRTINNVSTLPESTPVSTLNSVHHAIAATMTRRCPKRSDK